MPPYIVNGAPTLDTGWMTNPDPDIYSSWEEFAKQLFWDYQAVGEAFVLATARYSTGWPARFHVLAAVDGRGRHGRRPPPLPGRPRRRHRRTCSTSATRARVDDAHGHGPLEAGRATLIGAVGAEPVREHDRRRARSLRRCSTRRRTCHPTRPPTCGTTGSPSGSRTPATPAVLTGGLRLETTQLSPKEMALIELAQYTDSKIAVLLGVPPPLVGLPTAGDRLTYNTVLMALEQHWRTGLRPKATAVMAGLSPNGCSPGGRRSR